jgi:hypothetical protein
MDTPASGRCDPEQPELLESPAADDEGGTSAARRVHGEVRDRNADQMNECKSQSDGDLKAKPTGILP